MIYCALNDCECYPWNCLAVISVTMNDYRDCPYAIEMSEEPNDTHKEVDIYG